MNRRPPFSRLLALLCFIALIGAQALGGVRGYVCDCSGTTEWTMQDHCYGPHHADCHRDGSQDGGDGTGDRKNHEQVGYEVQVRLLPALEAPALVPVLVAVLDDPAFDLSPAHLSTPAMLGNEGAGPPRSVVVARTTVLLI